MNKELGNNFFKTYKLLLVMVFFLVCLGAAVRAMNAGLSCPDWPLCFGDFIPDFHPQVYFEFIHRVLAGLVGILASVLMIIVIRNKSVPVQLRALSITAIFLLLLQIIMGGLTVLLQLHEEVVAAHLSLGTGFFGVLIWIYFSLRYNSYAGPQLKLPRFGKLFAYGSIAAVYMQIVLGGLVASHYAALVCPDFPTCHGQWIPTLKGIIGLHVIHRLGAYALTIVLVSYAIYLLINITDKVLKRSAWALMFLICLQIGIGISNVVFLRPPIITVLHLGAGTALLALCIFLCRRLNYYYSAST